MFKFILKRLTDKRIRELESEIGRLNGRIDFYFNSNKQLQEKLQKLRIFNATRQFELPVLNKIQFIVLKELMYRHSNSLSMRISDLKRQLPEIKSVHRVCGELAKKKYLKRLHRGNYKLTLTK